MTTDVPEDLRGQYAGIVSRAAALVIDALIVLVTYWVGVLIFALVVGLLRLEGPSMPSWDVGLGLILYLGWWNLYLFIGWSLFGMTAGKLLMGVKIVRIDGSRLPWTRCAIRVVAYWLSAAAFFIGFLWALVDNKKRCWHDLLAGSCVVYHWDAKPAGLWQAKGTGQLATPESEQHS